MFFWGAKNRYYTQLYCSARVPSWPLADAALSVCRGSFRGNNGRASWRIARRLLTHKRHPAGPASEAVVCDLLHAAQS